MASIFGFSLVVVYASSMIYYAILFCHARVKVLLCIIDHAVIHLFIAGMYTSFVLVVFGGVVYTVGVLFFLIEGCRWMHVAWYGFVLVGSVLYVVVIVIVVV